MLEYITILKAIDKLTTIFSNKNRLKSKYHNLVSLVTHLPELKSRTENITRKLASDTQYKIIVTKLPYVQHIQKFN